MYIKVVNLVGILRNTTFLHKNKRLEDFAWLQLGFPYLVII